MYAKVDPAALLVAVLAVGVTPLTEDGPWDPINTIVATTVWLVVSGFTWPRGTVTTPVEFEPWIGRAQAAVYGFVSAIGLAWVVQSVMTGRRCSWLRPSDQCIEESEASIASLVALGIGVGVAVFVYFRLRKATEDLEVVTASGSSVNADSEDQHN